MKIVIIQHSGFLNGTGGTEKICCFLSNILSKNNFEVEIATNQESGGNPMFQLDEKVKITNIFDKNVPQKKLLELYNYRGKNPFLWIYYKIQKKYYKVYNKNFLKKMNGIDEFNKFNLHQRSQAWKDYIVKSNPNLIITMTINSLLEITFENEYNIPIINSVNGRPDYDYSDILWYRSKIDIELLRDSYKNLSAIQVLFDSYKNYLPNTFKGKSYTIPNPVFQIDDSEIVNHYKEKERFKILNVASLVTSCKQQDVAIRVFSKIVDKYPTWDLHFWGIGDDLEALQNQVKQLKLEDRVFFNGFTKKPIDKMKESDVFIFPSKYEGFPLALTEAMSVGLPSIGFQTCSGVNELIENNVNGFLVNNERELQESLENLIVSKDLRKQIGANAHQMIKKFNENNVSGKWIDVINQILTS
ncbi:glycosyltransferase involved in cell wall biosynthesis [Flavobacterium chryseum]|uniref:glycosyltransferase n=1 Tax=Flavobacterium sp. P3160 TaxID=2512113 RepID=UPI00105E8D0A|nr:glycosyltransferase [Flavobacterium sp. P3160]TDO72797.1 glycosyltransferase involved in cell wall biosynthesis [Flavobacterium sp. P3160]